MNSAEDPLKYLTIYTRSTWRNEVESDGFLLFRLARDPEWQLEDHPGSLLHPVPLQAAAATAAAVLPVPGGAQPADRGHRLVRQRPQNPRNAVQVGLAEGSARGGLGLGATRKR